MELVAVLEERDRNRGKQRQAEPELVEFEHEEGVGCHSEAAAERNRGFIGRDL